MAVVEEFDGANRVIRLKQGITSFNPVHDLYTEYKQYRTATDEFKKFQAFMEAGGNVYKYTNNGVDYHTPRYVRLLAGCKIVPFDEETIIRVTGEIFTDVGDNVFDLDGLGNPVDVIYKPPVAELLKVYVGGSALTETQAYQLDEVRGMMEELKDFTYGRHTVDTATNELVVYKPDNVTELTRFSLHLEDGTQNYNGATFDRRVVV
jgi:hypothetical protein